MFALSLSWNTQTHRGINQKIAQILRAGFKTVELNFSLTEKDIIQIDRLRRAGLINVVSCHNFCPIPPGISVKRALPDYYSLSSLKEKTRRLAVKYTKRSLDTACALKAKALVIHSGRVEIPDTSKQLMSLFAQGRASSIEFKNLANAMRREREKHKGAYLEQVALSIKELSQYSQKKGIKIGLENRIYYPEIPQLEELGPLLNNRNVYFWFDTGHAYIMQKLWSVPFIKYLRRYSQKIIGMHLHDIRLMRDHCAPGTGEFNFKILKPFISPQTIKVIEAHAPATPRQLTRSAAVLKKILE